MEKEKEKREGWRIMKNIGELGLIWAQGKEELKRKNYFYYIFGGLGGFLLGYDT